MRRREVKVLIVDDRREDLLAMRAILDGEGYEIVTASSGDEALMCVLRDEFAVIVLDAAMPALDGFETAALIRRRGKSRSIPIIFVSGVVYDMEHVMKAYAASAADFLPKPIDPSALRAKVAVFADLYRQALEIEERGEELRRAERREREFLEALYRATFEEAPIGIGHATIQGKWLRANRRLSEIVGHPLNDLQHLRLEDVVHPDDRASVVETIRHLLAADGAPQRHEYRLVRPDGSTAWIVLTISLLRDCRGSPVQLTIVEDISDRKDLEASLRARTMRELREAVRARDDFLSLSAHELKGPLTPIVLMVSGLLAHAMKSEEPLSCEWLVHHLKPAEHALYRLSMLVDTLVEVSRATVGDLRLEREDVDLAELIRDVVNRMRSQIEDARCPLTMTLHGPIVGRWDRAQLEHALNNVISNAVKYGPGAGVEIEATRDVEVARLSVRDHGIGIRAEDQARIFDRFERLVSPRNHGGFGVGLWIARQIVEAHGGSIRLWSEPGEGSRFTLELPYGLSETRGVGGRPEQQEVA